MTTRADATAAPLPAPAPPDEVGIGDLWPVLRRTWWIIAVCVALAGGAALLYVATADRVYEAVASLRIEPQQTRFTSIGPQPAPAASNQVQSEMLELQSRQLAGEVAQALGLQLAVETPGVARGDILGAVQVAPRVAARELVLERDGAERLRLVDRTTGRTLASAAPGGTIALPGLRVTLAEGAARHAPVELALEPLDAAAEALQEATSIGRPNAEADVVTVRHEGTDPALVQAVVNEWTERFLARRQRAQTSEARSAVRFLRQQLDTLGTQLAASERALREFRERERVVDIETQASTQVSRLAELQASRTQLDAEREALAGVLGDVRRTARRDEGRTGYRRLAAFPSLLRSQATAELLSTLAQLEDQRAELLVRRELKDPDVIVLTQRIAEVEEQLRGVAETYLQGLTGQVGALDASLARSGRELERLPARQVELARLQRTPQALGEIFTTLQTRLKEAQVAQAIDDPGVRLIDAATLPDEPVKPKPVLVLGLGLIVGAGLGVALALLRGHLDRRVYQVDAARALLGVPLLGAIPRLRAGGRWRGAATQGARDTRGPGTRPPAAGALLPAAAPDGDSPGGEAFRRLRTNLLVLARHEDRASRTLLVASALPDDGRTLCATNLATAFARQGLRTLLVDADLRAGAVASRLGLRAERGLSELLANGVHPTTPMPASAHLTPPSTTSAPPAGELALALAAAVQEVALPDGKPLAVLGAGRTPSNPAELLGTPRFGALLASAREAYDMVVVDAPPVRASTDADVVAAVVDGVVLVVRMGHTTTDALRYAAGQLRNVDARVLGLVANDVRGADAA